MWDGRVSWIGSVILMILFTGYFALLFLNNSVLRASKKISGLFRKSPEPGAATEAGTSKLNFYTIEIKLLQSKFLFFLFLHEKFISQEVFFFLNLILS